MKTKLAILFIAIVPFFTKVNAQTTYKVDVQKSVLNWVGKKITGEHKGTVNLSSGSFTIDKAGTITAGSFDIDMTSIKNVDLTDPEWNAKLVGHLKSDDFFGVEKFPKAHFAITSPSKIVKGNSTIKGKLTIKGITHPVEFKAVLVLKDGAYTVYGNITIDRSKYDIKYGSGSFFDDLGDKTIYDEFNILLNVVTSK